VVIADDHPIYREGLARMLQDRSDFELVADCCDGAEAMEAIATRRPDVALLDVQMPAHGGIEILKKLRASGDLTPVVILSASDDGATVYASIVAGASGYLTKSADRSELYDALIKVARGGTVVPPVLQDGLVAAIRGNADGRQRLLSDRELEVLRLTSEGRSAPAVAAELIIGTATVRTHLRHIYEKLGVSDRAAAVAEAIRRELLH
jgi:two-component system nitrate/nitrite response regulator NarL